MAAKRLSGRVAMLRAIACLWEVSLINQLRLRLLQSVLQEKKNWSLLKLIAQKYTKMSFQMPKPLRNTSNNCTAQFIGSDLHR